MTEYTLFLDESTSDDKNFICVGGFAIKNKSIDKLRSKINDIRKLIWDDEYIAKHDPILHSTELNLIHSHRNDGFLSSYIKREEYNIFATKNAEEIHKIYLSIYHELCMILKSFDITIFSCIINNDNYKYIYDGKFTDDYYHICLETIIENYIYFLNDKKGVGSIIYEARNSINRNDSFSPDEKMFNNFCAIKSQNKGIINSTPKSTLIRLRNFEYQRKSGQNLCLGLADFIIYNISKMQHIEDKNRNEFMHKIYNNAYNGNYTDDKNLRDYFGIRVLPEDIRLVSNLKEQNEHMRKKIKNQKNEINKLNRINNDLKNKFDKIEKEIDKSV